MRRGGDPPERYACELVVDAAWCRGSVPLWIDKTSVGEWEHALGRLERGRAVTWPVWRRGEPAIHLVPGGDCLHVTVKDSEIPIELTLRLPLGHDWIDDQRVLLEETRRRFPGLADPA